MKNLKIPHLVTFCLISLAYASCSFAQESRFEISDDLLLLNYDLKTDVDDLHSIAAATTFLSDPRFSDVEFHAVAGAYGVQDGEYVPGNKLFEIAFPGQWSDAHADFDQALKEVTTISKQTLDAGGSIWVAEAGQSDFSAALVRALQTLFPDPVFSTRIHIVQHSDWNESVTSERALRFVKEHISYHKVPDGNTEGNGTPGFTTRDLQNWKSYLSDGHLLNVWQTAIDLGQKYNGADGRYLNERISEGGLDFSDTAEIMWMFGFEDIPDPEYFFKEFGITQ